MTDEAEAFPAASAAAELRHRVELLELKLEYMRAGEASRSATAIVDLVVVELHEAAAALGRAAEVMRAKGLPSDARRAHEAALRAGRMAEELRPS